MNDFFDIFIDDFDKYIPIILFICLTLLILYIIFRFKASMLLIPRNIKDTRNYEAYIPRKVPLDYDLDLYYYFTSITGSSTEIGTYYFIFPYLLKWLKSSNIMLRVDLDKSRFKEACDHNDYNIILLETPEFNGILEKYLWEFLEKVSEKYILSIDGLCKYAKVHEYIIRKDLSNILSKLRAKATKDGLLKYIDLKNFILTNKGLEKVKEFNNFKSFIYKFTKDYYDIDLDKKLWDDFLILSGFFNYTYPLNEAYRKLDISYRFASENKFSKDYLDIDYVLYIALYANHLSDVFEIQTSDD